MDWVKICLNPVVNKPVVYLNRFVYDYLILFAGGIFIHVLYIWEAEQAIHRMGSNIPL